MTDKNLYFQAGTLQVNAKGYWYSGGGEKGAFGYYPHLKDALAYPVYPDTQIRGDLAMAARWLNNLDSEIWQDSLTVLFGGQGKETTTPFFLTDLVLTDESKEKWDKVGGRFADKTRIAVEDNRTVEEHMLVSFEYAFLDELTLTANLYLGYFNDEKKLKSAATLLTECAPLLSGFGAFRSRGYGRGMVEINWDDPVCIEQVESEQKSGKKIACFMEALTHVRNRPLDPEGSQVITTRRSLSSLQVRGWLAMAYSKLYGDWPSDTEMSAIRFPDFHPTPANDYVLTYPSPRTTVRDEEKNIKDMTGRDGDRDNETDHQENLMRSKTKPLSDRCFVTNAPSVYEAPTGIRFRNVMKEVGDFRTKDEGGLFAQEFLPAGIWFSGMIELPDTSFGKRCRYLLEKIKPVIAGAVFNMRLVDLASATVIDSINGHLLVADMPYDKDLLQGKGNSVCLFTRRAFNTANGRLRRNRIVIGAGAVLADEKPELTMPWPGFGKDNISAIPDAAAGKKSTGPVAGPPVTIPENVKKQLTKISRAQAGQLRELLHPGLTTAYLQRFLNERLNKYDQWKKDKDDERLLPRVLLDDLKNRLSKEHVNMETIQAYIAAVHQEIRRHWWKPPQPKTTEGGRS